MLLAEIFWETIYYSLSNSQSDYNLRYLCIFLPDIISVPMFKGKA